MSGLLTFILSASITRYTVGTILHNHLRSVSGSVENSVLCLTMVGVYVLDDANGSGMDGSSVACQTSTGFCRKVSASISCSN